MNKDDPDMTCKISVLVSPATKKYKYPPEKDGNTMRKVKITITGENIHDIGYRFFLYNMASRLALSHFDAWNIMDENQIVEVYAGGDSRKIERLVNFSKNNFPPQANVSDVTDEDYEGNIRTIASFERSFMLEQQSKFVNYGLGILTTMNRMDGTLSEMNKKQDMMLEKQDMMLEKQDSMLEKQDSLQDAVERGFSELKDEHIKTREMSMEIFRSEVQVLREEIDSLRSSVEEIRRKVGIA